MIAMQNLSLIASRDLPAGETVLTVPESAFISPSAASKHPLLSPLTSSKGQQALAVDNWILLALLLIVERHSPSKGEWASYAQSLPDPSSLSSSTHPLFWSDELLDELQGTQLLASIGAYISFFASSYESVRNHHNPSPHIPSPLSLSHPSHSRTSFSLSRLNSIGEEGHCLIRRRLYSTRVSPDS